MTAPTATASTGMITIYDHSALISIAIYFAMTTFVLSVIIRFALRIALAKTLGIDDWICFGSMIAGLGAVVSIAVGTKHGLGMQQSHLRRGQERAVAQAEYCGDIFFILALGLAKISVLMMLRRICVRKKHKTVALATCGLVAAWTVAGIVALAARCGTSLPWTATNVPDQCMNLHTFWIGMLPADVFTEAAIIILAVVMMRPVQVTIPKKAGIIGAFLSRSALVSSSIVRIFYLVDYVPSQNFTFTTINTEILNQVVLCVSITTACIPCLKPFLDVFDSGQMAVTVKDRSIWYGSDSYRINSLSYATENSGRHRVRALRKNNTINADTEPAELRQADSISSDARSDRMIINKTVEYTVQYHNVDGVERHSQKDPSVNI